jgi:hypothetical protein
MVISQTVYQTLLLSHFFNMILFKIITKPTTKTTAAAATTMTATTETMTTSGTSITTMTRTATIIITETKKHSNSSGNKQY